MIGMASWLFMNCSFSVIRPIFRDGPFFLPFSKGSGCLLAAQVQ